MVQSARDPISLLSRGYTSRFIGTAANGQPLLSTLAPEELEKDLRHMQAYYNAVLQYRSEMPLEAAPVKIDPEEERRRLTLRSKLQHAEVERQVLETQYVALRAHYVQVAQQKQPAESMLLATMVQERAQAVARARAKLQMMRDVSHVLEARTLDQVPVANNDRLSETWSAAEDVVLPKKSTVDFPCTHLPWAPPGVPLFLSTTSPLPDKTLAWKAGMDGCDKSMTWLDSLVSDDTDSDLETLREQVAALKSELDRQKHVHSLPRIYDRYVARMMLLRQETEAVLQRHNIILESAVGQAKAAQAWDEHQPPPPPAEEGSASPRKKQKK